MYYVYVLSSNEKVYISYTQNLKRRLAEHNKGQSASTKGFEWTLVYYEAYRSEVDARTRERKFKQDGRSRYQLMQRIIGSRVLS